MNYTVYVDDLLRDNLSAKVIMPKMFCWVIIFLLFSGSVRSMADCVMMVLCAVLVAIFSALIAKAFFPYNYSAYIGQRVVLSSCGQWWVISYPWKTIRIHFLLVKFKSGTTRQITIRFPFSLLYAHSVFPFILQDDLG